MKKLVCMMAIVLMLCGGCSSMGSIEKGDLDLEEAIIDIEDEISKENWQIATLNGENISSEELQEVYGLKVDQVEAYMAKLAIIPIELGEIAIFKVNDKQSETVKAALIKHIDNVKSELNGFTTQQQVLDAYKLEQFGSYLVLVIGSDAQSVIQYISSL